MAERGLVVLPEQVPAATGQDTLTVLPVEELQDTAFLFTDSNILRATREAEVWYQTCGHKLTFSLENVKTKSGIQPTDAMFWGSMTVQLTPEQSALVQKHVDDIIFLMAYANREPMMRQHGWHIEKPYDLRLLYRGLVQEGVEKLDDLDGKPQLEPDCITGNVAMRLSRKHRLKANKRECRVEDLLGRPFRSCDLRGKMLRKVVVQVDKVVFFKTPSIPIRVDCSFRNIVVNEAAPTYPPKRRKHASGASKKKKARAE